MRYRFGRDWGRGLLAAAADNNPTTIAVLVMVGVTMTYTLLWLVVLVIPMLAIVQAISAALGVSKLGLTGALKKRFGPVWVATAIALVLLINILTPAFWLDRRVRGRFAIRKHCKEHVDMVEIARENADRVEPFRCRLNARPVDRALRRFEGGYSAVRYRPVD